MIFFWKEEIVFKHILQMHAQTLSGPCHDTETYIICLWI